MDFAGLLGPYSQPAINFTTNLAAELEPVLALFIVMLGVIVMLSVMAPIKWALMRDVFSYFLSKNVIF